MENKTEWYRKLLRKLNKIKSGELDLDEYIDEVKAKIEAESQALSMSGVSDLVRDWVEKHQREAWNKMGDTGNDQYQENINQENYWFGYFRALEDFESEFLESTYS